MLKISKIIIINYLEIYIHQYLIFNIIPYKFQILFLIEKIIMDEIFLYSIFVINKLY